MLRLGEEKTLVQLLVKPSLSHFLKLMMGVYFSDFLVVTINLS